MCLEAIETALTRSLTKDQITSCRGYQRQGAETAGFYSSSFCCSSRCHRPQATDMQMTVSILSQLYSLSMQKVPLRAFVIMTSANEVDKHVSLQLLRSVL